jgi:probable rRNA maturation factor
MSGLHLRNRQSLRRLNFRLLRRIIDSLLGEHLQVEQYELCFHFIGAVEMARINSQFLGHSGSTDVITFDHGAADGSVYGEAFICLDDAVSQARQFRTTWQSELVRYVVHALLHLDGEDDRTALARRRMKRRERELMRVLARRFALSRLADRPRLRQ